MVPSNGAMLADLVILSQRYKLRLQNAKKVTTFSPHIYRRGSYITAMTIDICTIKGKKHSFASDLQCGIMIVIAMVAVEQTMVPNHLSSWQTTVYGSFSIEVKVAQASLRHISLSHFLTYVTYNLEAFSIGLVYEHSFVVLERRSTYMP